MKPLNSILETVGNTPVVRLNRIGDGRCNLFAKVESFNPMGSVKDRLALGIIEDAERTGRLKPGQTVVEATSGNTGIALAMVCAVKGHPLVVTMAESFSVERRRLMRFLGAKVVLTPASEKGSGMYRKAEELAEKHGWFLARQFENPANPEVHARTTAQEILASFEDMSLDYWVTGSGTGGTLKGVATVLREKSPHTQIILAEPDNAPIVSSGQRTAYDSNGAPLGSHPSFRPHLMQGWTPDFISKITSDAIDDGLIDRVIGVDGNEALRLSRALALQEGILAGTSAGATLAAALEVAAQASEGSNILCMLPDTGERYLSTPLFQDIGEEMDDEEQGISRSTQGYRFDVKAEPPAAAHSDEMPAIDEQAIRYIDAALSDREQPVVLFALEWCEFCWSARKLFQAIGLSYRSIDLDSRAMQEGEFGGKVRAALESRTGMKTIPQLFVGAEFVGGCTELFDAYKDGRLEELLKLAKADFEMKPDLDPYQLLPKWLQPRQTAA
jgi:cysteine synthase A